MSEFVVVVDENDRIVRHVTRKEMRAYGLRHRGTAILVFNLNGQLFVHKRSATKDMFPSYYDIAVGGVVESGETYEASAKRELAEELGITGVELKFLFKVQYESVNHKCFTTTYSCVYDGLITLQDEEIEEGFFIEFDRAKDFVLQHPICPDSLEVINHFWKKYGQDWKNAISEIRE